LSVRAIHGVLHDWSERKRLPTVPGIIRYVALTELVRYATAGLSGKGLPTVTIIIRYGSIDRTTRYATVGPSDKELSTETAITHSYQKKPLTPCMAVTFPKLDIFKRCKLGFLAINKSF
jgi:hypothetical protein